MSGAEVRTQKAIVEPADSGDLDGYVFIMCETGEVVGARSPRRAARMIKARARSGNPGATVTEIEWRDGLTPPEEELR